jgi:hypothetical protein
MATKNQPAGHHDDPESARSNAPGWLRQQIASAPGRLHRASPHEGSKHRMVQLTDTAQDAASAALAAQRWSAETGRPIPPQLRARQPLGPAVRMGRQDRVNRYTRARRAERLTGPQQRRIAHKARLTAEQRAELRGES